MKIFASKTAYFFDVHENEVFVTHEAIIDIVVEKL